MNTDKATKRYDQLVAELAYVKAEISSYPRPIAGCDAQFNYLLERRDELLAALSSTETAQRSQISPGM